MSFAACGGDGLPGGSVGVDGLTDAGGVDHAPLVLGEYLIDASELGEAAPVHVSIVSSTAAIVTPRFGLGVEFVIEEQVGAALGVEPSEPGNVLLPPPEIHGAFILREARAPEQQELARQVRLSAIALSGTESSTHQRQALLLHRVELEPRMCLRPSQFQWQGAAGMAAADTTPTDVRLGPLSPGRPFFPWNGVRLQVAKPLSAPPATIVAQVGNENIDLVWFQDLPYFPYFVGRFSTWPALFGRTVELSGWVAATNGVPSPAPTTSLDVFSLGNARSTGFDLTSPPEGLATWGGAAVAHALPGTEPECEAGCLRVSTGGGIGFRFVGPVASIRIRHKGNSRGQPGGNGTPRTGPLDARVAYVVDGVGTGTSSSTISSVAGEMSESELTVNGPHDEVYVVLEVNEERVQTQSDPRCDLYYPQAAYIEAITLIRP